MRTPLLTVCALTLLLTATADAKPKPHVFLAPPAGLTCPIAEGVITATWEPVLNATKYSVEVTAGYDTNADGLVDVTGEFDFGSVDPTEAIPLAELALEVDTNADGLLETFAPISVVLKVKALNPGHGSGRQNNPFSALCVAL